MNMVVVMSEQGKSVKSLSEISHLFLSNIRDKHAGSAPRPRRIPPQQPAKTPSVDLTPEEFTQVFSSPEARDPEAPNVPPVHAILASHLGPRQLDTLRRYARSLAADQRIGLLYIDASELRIFTFENSSADTEPAASPEPVPFDSRIIRDTINELNWDLDRWLLVVGNVKLPEGRALLRAVDRWTALAASDHEGIISCYRMLKGLADIQRPISLAIIDSASPDAQAAASSKIASVCQQFLNWHIEPAAAPTDAPDVAECPVLHCAAPRDKAQPSNGAHWKAVLDLLEQAKLCATLEEPPIAARPALPPDPVAQPGPAAEPIVEPIAAPVAEPAIMEPVFAPRLAVESPVMLEVIDLPMNGSQPILAAVMQHHMSDLVECPLRPPMCPEACLAVGRDHRLVLVATAGQGLAELRAVGQAYRWAAENRSLLAMAMPQFALDPHQLPHVRLLVDHADLSADVLQPLMQVDTVRIQTYRRIRWGQRTGLLLDAA